MTIALFDFNDSFILNICEVLESLGYKVDILTWAQKELHASEKKYDLFIFGPGPGHVLDYKISDNFLDSLLDTPVLGICLGHQVLLKHLGYQLIPLEHPLHGKSLPLEKVGDALDLNEVKGQFYNSWQIVGAPKLDHKAIYYNDMLVYFHWNKWVSVQFHPESVGTSCPHAIFKKLLSKIV